MRLVPLAAVILSAAALTGCNTSGLKMPTFDLSSLKPVSVFGEQPSSAKPEDIESDEAMSVTDEESVVDMAEEPFVDLTHTSMTRSEMYGTLLAQSVMKAVAGVDGTMLEVFDNNAVKVEIPGYLGFSAGSDLLRPQAFTLLKNLTDVAKEYPSAAIEFLGYTDNRLTDIEVKRISYGRALAVEEFFVSQGIPSDRMKSIGMGAGNPAASNASEGGRQANRRVVVIISPPAGI